MRYCDHLFEWEHLGEDVVVGQRLLARPQDGQHFCPGAHQQLCDTEAAGQRPDQNTRRIENKQRDAVGPAEGP